MNGNVNESGVAGRRRGVAEEEGVRGARVQAERMKLPAMVIEVEQSAASSISVSQIEPLRVTDSRRRVSM